MKLLVAPILISLNAGSLHAQALQKIPTSEPSKKVAPRYVAEAPLPKGWPKPGPYNIVSEKNFPAYRAAFTNSRWQNFAFMRLFKHIKRNDIPMTSPVEMKMEKKQDAMTMTTMGFLYQNTKVGKTGKDGKTVVVKDLPAMKTLSYTWQGSNNQQSLRVARAALENALKLNGVDSKNFRVLGYNGPGVPKDKKTWEMIAILTVKK